MAVSNKKLLKETEELLKKEVTPEELFDWAFCLMNKICKANGWGDPNSYARGKEIRAAIALGHQVSQTLSGADAYNEAGQAVEYKSTIGAKMNMSYTGVSVQKTWKEQEEYLKKDKILPYPEHYANRFDDEGNLVESWVLSGRKVYDLLLPKLLKSWESRKNRKDPRLSANLTEREIKLHGTRVI